MISLIKKNFWLILIVLISILLRTYKLSSYPEAVDEDEMSLGYISYSLLHSRTDEYTNKFPIYFKSVIARFPPTSSLTFLRAVCS